MHDKATLFAWAVISAVIAIVAAFSVTIWNLVSGFIRAA